MSLHAEWMFLLCRRHHVTSCRMDVFTMQSVMHCIMSHVEWMFLHCVMYNGCFCLAGSGLGKRMAYRFVELGCDIALWDINGESLECMVQDFEGQVAVKAYTVDLASREQIYKVRVECQESRVKSQGCTVHTCILLQLARNCVCVCVWVWVCVGAWVRALVCVCASKGNLMKSMKQTLNLKFSFIVYSYSFSLVVLLSYFFIWLW